MVVVGTPNVGIRGAWAAGAVGGQRMLIEAVLQNGSHTLIAMGLQGQGTDTGSFEPLRTIGFA